MPNVEQLGRTRRAPNRAFEQRLTRRRARAAPGARSARAGCPLVREAIEIGSAKSASHTCTMSRISISIAARSCERVSDAASAAPSDARARGRRVAQLRIERAQVTASRSRSRPSSRSIVARDVVRVVEAPPVASSSVTRSRSARRHDRCSARAMTSSLAGVSQRVSSVCSVGLARRASACWTSNTSKPAVAAVLRPSSTDSSAALDVARAQRLTLPRMSDSTRSRALALRAPAPGSNRPTPRRRR